MKKPFFSIITCTKNSERFLMDNITSVRSQTFKDYEHIFIDGCSNDKTVFMEREYKKSNKSKVKIYSLPPKGINDALNQGARRATGKWVFFLNGDDFLFNKNTLSRVYKLLSSNSYVKYDWVYGKINSINEFGQNLGRFPSNNVFKKANYNLLKMCNYVPHQATFVKKHLFEDGEYYDNAIKTVGDYEYWLRIGKKYKWSYMDCVVSNYRIWRLNNAKKYSFLFRLKEDVVIHLKHLNIPEMIPYFVTLFITTIYYEASIFIRGKSLKIVKN